MSASRTERLLNLLLALLNTRVGLPRSVLREKVYHDSAENDVAFGRMFERDKVDLKQFGFDIETLTDPRHFGVDDPASTRYRIGKDSNRLPDVTLTPAECTVLLLAAQLWERAALGTAAANAVRKLQAAGGLTDVDLPAGVQPRIKPAGQAFDDVVAAMHGNHPVRFGYLAVSTGREEVREVEPWGLGSRFGQWYLVGFDRGRGAKRLFRLSRMTTAVSVVPGCSFDPPSGFNARAELDALHELPVQRATLAVDKDRLLALRKRAVETAPEGTDRDRVVVEFRDPEVLAEELASYGPHVKVDGPAELRTAVVRRLQGALDFDAKPAIPVAFPEAGRAQRARKRTSEDQLARMLQLVPFLVHHQGLHIQEVADHFGISRKALIDDLKILICSGLPEGYPDDLLDIQWENDHVYISEHLDLNRPVRFSEDEAAALLTGLAMLGDLPALAGVSEDQPGSALESVTIKLTGAAGKAGRLAGAVAGQSVEPEQSQAFAVITQAIRDGRQLHLKYLSRQRDELTERDVDPLRLYSLDNTWYFEAYCHSKAGIRNFRLDRVEIVEPNGRPASGVATADQDFPARLFTPSDDDVLVVLHLTRQGAGLADDYYAERTARLPDGGLLAEVRFGTAEWLPMFVSQHGGAVRILDPGALRDATRAWLDSAVKQYDSSSDAAAG
ncbi:YafY family protein [Paenarthrobacter sp. CM16]|uniref:helix-turn-helix transcriptional regulator n=1 Tax=Paenarthrobacter sp. CM16 TaxID=2738447 RepID=UPI001551FE66|nr:WYL domain-containing protein [Paenarthrobacter sp. CM16]